MSLDLFVKKPKADKTAPIKKEPSMEIIGEVLEEQIIDDGETISKTIFMPGENFTHVENKALAILSHPLERFPLSLWTIHRHKFSDIGIDMGEVKKIMDDLVKKLDGNLIHLTFWNNYHEDFYQLQDKSMFQRTIIEKNKKKAKKKDEKP